MDPKWNIAFCNVTFTEYARMTYRDYYASPVNTLEAQLIAKSVAEEKYGVGCFVEPYVDTPEATISSCLGMPNIETDDDEINYLAAGAPLLRAPADVNRFFGWDPKTSDLLIKRWQAWRYYRSRGYDVRLGGHDASIITVAHEISAGNIFLWLLEDPAGAERVLDAVTEADLSIRAFDDSLCGATNSGYSGDDYAGLLSPELFRRFAIPQYQRIYANRTDRFMHSELLRAEHLRIAKDLLQITCFHGAGCKNLTLTEMHQIMGHEFWTQLTPQDLLELSPHAIAEMVKAYANSGCGYLQLYPGRGTPDVNLRAAISAAEQECKSGRIVNYV
jgi:hypothetical protein